MPEPAGKGPPGPVDARNRVLRVAQLLATRQGDEERGPAVWIHPEDARQRLLVDGELAWVYGPRRHELAVVHVDPGARRGDVVLRDVAGASPSELVRLVKPDLDDRGRTPSFA
ncbi:MAG: molybdopterin dinucleotide binding domain-containing protein [Gemmatimonadaceae bacterium]